MYNIDQFIRKMSLSVYYWMIVLLYLLYFATILGISYFNNIQQYIHYLNSFIQIFVAVVLLIRFNPLRNIKLAESDVPLIIASASFLLLNAGVTGWILSYTKNNIEHTFAKIM